MSQGEDVSSRWIMIREKTFPKGKMCEPKDKHGWKRHSSGRRCVLGDRSWPKRRWAWGKDVPFEENVFLWDGKWLGKGVTHSQVTG